MKRFFYSPLIFILLLGCKKDKIDTQPDEIMKPLVGKWRLTEVEQVVNGQNVWVQFAGYEAVYKNFRFDGIELYQNGKASCCAPKIYNINNTRYEVLPKSEVTYFADCSTVYCVSCPSYDIEVNGNEMVIASCTSSKSKYIRVD